LDAFRAAVHVELRTFAFWTRDYQDTLRALSGQDAQPSAQHAADTADRTHADGPLTQRAAWVQRELDRRGMNLESLHRAGGPDRKTTTKILAAQPVSENVLKRLIVGLSSEKPPVRRADIP
jgi:hypothetical protein